MKHALFPLHTVLFPGSILPLQIFEQRYLSLVKDCLKQETGFITVLISDGKEVGAAPQIYRTGCFVEITDWEALTNGLLGITIEAKYRVHLSNSSVRDDGLLLAEASTIQSTFNHKQTPAKMLTSLSDTLQQLLNHPFSQQYKNKINFNNTAEVCYRLSELLPISNKQKQQLLETETSEQILDLLTLHINALQK